MNTTLADYQFRTATLADKAQLMQLGIASYSPYASVLTPDNWKQLNEFLHDEEKLVELINKSKVFVCTGQDEIVGMAFFVPNGNPWDVFLQEWSYIRMVGVHPAHQGNGIARRLTQLCIDYAKETNELVIALHTSEFMDAARHIYEKLGFKRVREMELRLGKRYWLYMLDLNP